MRVLPVTSRLADRIARGPIPVDEAAADCRLRKRSKPRMSRASSIAVTMLPKALDEEVARLHLTCFGVARFYSEAPDDQGLKNPLRIQWRRMAVLANSSLPPLGTRLFTERFATASMSHLHQPMAMLRLKSSQRATLADKLPDAANVVLAGFVVGQAVSGRPFSLALALVGMATWAALMIAAVLLAVQRRNHD